ncbi:MAG: hypothetical protein JW734_02330 [Candidatus Omnitrophica bacterium]|nr:hypothetical protein [Candidatus Omnitrophota bacterium]
MDKSKVPIIILVLLFLGSTFFTFRFYTESQNLFKEKEKLVKDNEDLARLAEKYKDENKSLLSKNKDLSSRLEDIQAALDRVEKEGSSYKKKYEEISAERDMLIEQIKKVPIERAAEMRRPSVVKDDTSASDDAYWQDILQKKAELQIAAEDLASKLKEAQAKALELSRNNENLSSQINDLTKAREELERKINFNTRTIEILTKDLVREREDRKEMIEEINKLKSENISLARDLKLAQSQGVDLEQKLSRTSQEKQILAGKVNNIETILKEKALEIDSLQRDLSQTISSAKEVMPRKETKAVELPPIVVKSEAKPSVSVPLLQGKVLAVNEKEKFVIVDLGASSGIKPGDRFLVLKDGNKLASLEVIETRQDIAACDILDMIGSIREGDIVSLNP